MAKITETKDGFPFVCEECGAVAEVRLTGPVEFQGYVLAHWACGVLRHKAKIKSRFYRQLRRAEA